MKVEDNTPTYSLVLLEDPVPYSPTSPKTMKIIQTYWTLDEAKSAQKENKNKTIVIQTF